MAHSSKNCKRFLGLFFSISALDFSQKKASVFSLKSPSARNFYAKKFAQNLLALLSKTL